MNEVIMPKLITPELAEVIAEKPEVLKAIVDHQSGEKLIVGKNCTLDYDTNPGNVKFVFCNVTICINNTGDECGKSCIGGGTEKKIGSCRIAIEDRDHQQAFEDWNKMPGEMCQLKLEAGALEARVEEIGKTLRRIPRQVCNRKLIARCRKDMYIAAERLAIKKKELEYWASLMEFWGQ